MLNAAGDAAASDDDFLLVASQSSSPHEDAQSSASPLEDIASQTPPTVPEESLPAFSLHSMDQDMTGAAALTAGVAETSLKSCVLLADQQAAAISNEDAAAATSAPEHPHAPASFPGMLCTAMYRGCNWLSLVLAWHVPCALCQSFLQLP